MNIFISFNFSDSETLGFEKIAQESSMQNILGGGHGSLTIQMQRMI